ncbi:MAG TPA: hypothetical protein VF460_08110 [Burkholderiales bacterium]
MLRPISPPTAWQAIAAFAGFFTLFFAHADPVDLWRITVLSHQGEPLKAVATLESLPEERITEECLSLGSEADAPGSEVPLLKQAHLKLNAARNAVEISTDAPVSSPSLELVLRVQCPGTFLYARHFSALVPPASAAITGAGVQNGFRLKVGSGETVNSLAAAVAPGNRKLQKQLVREVIAANPRVFPGGKPVPIPAGTVLWFPDLRSVARAAASPAVVPPAVKPGQPPAEAARTAQAAPEPAAVPPPAPKPRRPKRAGPSGTGEPIKLRQALELGERPGPQECRLLLPLCGVLDPGGAASVSPQAEYRASGLETGMQALKLRQDSIDSQLSRLEQSLQELRQVVESRPAVAAPAPTPAPKPEIRTVVKTEYRTAPIPWYFWAGIAAAALAAAAGGFLYGRRRAYGESLADSDERLDEMLASAADEMRDLDRVPAPPPRMPRLTPAPPPPSVRNMDVEDVNGAAVRQPETPDMAFDKTQVMEAANVDLELESGHGEDTGGESTPGVSSDLAFEMDQALDNTRSMFTDVDRFIALGRTQNALSLLQFQVVKDPKDRDSWIKLLAIYRQEKMEVELEKSLRDFRRNFPNDKAAM